VRQPPVIASWQHMSFPSITSLGSNDAMRYASYIFTMGLINCFIFVIPRLTIPQSIIKDKRVKTKYHRMVKDTLRKIIDFLTVFDFSYSVLSFSL
jgi:hypothetical protein